jgi:hypothetical protein
MQLAHLGQMLLQWLAQRIRQDRDAVFRPLAGADNDLTPGEIHILHPQPQES